MSKLEEKTLLDALAFVGLKKLPQESDLDNYLSNERGFYLDYRKDLPGPIVYSTEELVDAIKEGVVLQEGHSRLVDADKI